jgi:hypothetical protein
MRRRTPLAAALTMVASLALSPSVARADDTPATPTLSLSAEEFYGFSRVALQVRVPGDAGDWSITSRLAASAEALDDASAGPATVAAGGSYGQSFAYEGWQSMTPLTGGARYWVEVTAQPADASIAPVTLTESIIAAAIPATITIRSHNPLGTMPAGYPVILDGTVDRAPACPPNPQWGCAPRTTAQLQVRTVGTTTWRTLATAPTGLGMYLSATVRPERSGDYRWYHPADGAVTETASPLLHIDARANGLLILPTSATVGHAVHGSARILPAVRGQRVTLQVFDGHWRKVTTGTVDGKGIAHFSFTPKKKGTWKYRVPVAARPDLLAGDTTTAKLKVKLHH